MLLESKKFRKLCNIGSQYALKYSQMSQSHCALVIDNHGSIISIGVNYSNRTRYNKCNIPGVHAEMESLRTIPKSQRKNIHLISIHPSRSTDNAYKPSKPCKYCLDWCKKWNINKLYYVNDNYQWVCEKVKNMHTEYLSNLVRNSGKHYFK
jgi:tRNA(Arg) A34 adenosine deaminase TadA